MNRLGAVLQHLRKISAKEDSCNLRDEELLERFVTHRDETAFEFLLARHGPMVLNVCRRMLPDQHLVQDAFQATFLVLVRKASSIGKRELLTNWLYGVAYRTAAKAKVEAAKRRARESAVNPKQVTDPLTEISARELLAVLDEELSALPAQYRGPLVLCYLEGKTRDEAAKKSAWSLATLARRLERGRKLLKARLDRRGLALPMTLFSVLLAGETASASVPSSWVASTVEAATLIAAGQTVAAGVVSPNVIALTQGVLKTMSFSKLKATAAILFIVGLLGTGVGGMLIATTTLPAKSQIPPDQEKGQLREANQKEVPDAKRILGTWKVVAIEVNGKTNRDPKSPGLSHGPWIITAEKITQEGTHFTEEKGYFKGKSETPYKLDSTKSPKEIDFIETRLDGTKNPKPALGIYSLDGDTLRICMAAGDEQPRPTEFATKPGSNLYFQVLKRQPQAKDASQTRATDAGDLTGPLEFVQPVSDIVSSPDRSLLATIVYRRGKVKERDQFSDAAKSDLEVKQDIFATVTVRDAKTGKETFTTGELKDPRIRRFTFSPDGTTLAISFQRPFSEGIKTDKVELWDLKTGNVRQRIELDHGGCMAGLAFSSDGKTLAVSGHADRGTTGGVRLVDVESGKLKKAFKVEKAVVAEVAFSPDGETLAAASSAMDKHEVLLWDLSAGKVKKVLESTSEDVLALAYSPDGKRLVGGGADGQLELWDLKTGKATLLPSPSELTDKIIFSPDGRRLATSGRSGEGGKYTPEAKLWDLVTSQLLKAEKESQVITFSADGNRLAVLQNSKKVISWEVENATPKESASRPEAKAKTPKNTEPLFAAEFAKIKVAMNTLVQYTNKGDADARTEDENEALIEKALEIFDRDGTPLAEKALALVGPHVQDPAAVDVLVWILEHRPASSAAVKAADLLIQHHLKNSDTQKTAFRWVAAPMPWTEKLLRALAAADLPRESKGHALFHLALSLKAKAVFPGLLKSLDGHRSSRMMELRFGKAHATELRSGDVAKLEAEAIRLFTEIAERYGNEKYGVSTLEEHAKRAIYEIQNLTVGKTTPEIGGEDIDGKPMKLSDYKGKVVVLSFWGHW